MDKWAVRMTVILSLSLPVVRTVTYTRIVGAALLEGPFYFSLGPEGGALLQGAVLLEGPF